MEVENKINNQPNRSSKTNNNAVMIVIGIIVIFIGMVIIAGGVDTSNNNNTTNTATEDTKITLEKFNKIETGMTYEQVVEIIGEEGQILSESDITGTGEYKATLYCWKAKNGIANANITIQSGKVISKAQIGLE